MTATAAPYMTSPREHLLAVAGELFYREGITGVGIERILAEARTTRATLYRHFAGKGALVVAYLEREDAMLKAAFQGAESVAMNPEHLLELAIEGIAEDANRHHTRGCPFINATAEYADAQSPVRKVVSSHRRWFRGQLERYLDAAGRVDPGDRADELVMLRDAVLVGSYLDDRSAAHRTFIRAARTAASIRG
ncbi:TetR/AcrR family transcriptional regulator [Curtobacterium flaccumfaciens pv. flaccumfaciens]|jgi:AcrR family transcriptional regulator|uniref:TetR/AcrR family transcriptional regulator n=1 Tax=Curtobacterium flaccumfaciens TaxID=2035 RepID=UPI00217D2E11|nr:TetR/AcrR family transcriptional regulator [Curtobacterium flaccumfaciens]MCS6568016.1 TetR/AcrR family transcriptional regulator [Curtobacterium flaccumfaciens pv. flaccumfaciens]MCS6584118.1 TetR/AcrR family transcriptional regulator [Curtobacterium flaccumfaciens pv. flaccumfaciens]